MHDSTLDDLDSHPSRGASWEGFVIEDILRREKIEHPQAQAFFWRTAAGLEADLVLERGSRRVVIEIKVGEGDVARSLRRLQDAKRDVGARRGFLITQAGGVTPLAPGVERRGFEECIDWLP